MQSGARGLYNRSMKKLRVFDKRLTGYVFCLLCAALLMLLCTKSSPLYPLNDWEDANILSTMGRGMLTGRVPFRDLYDQKGPMAYLIYGLAWLISPRSYFGLYIIEALSFSGFLYFSWRSVTLFEESNALFCMPLLGALTASAMSFAHGGSVEELSLAALAFSFFDILRYYRRAYPAPMPYWRLLVHGALAGCLLWTKYTMLGFYIAWMGVLFIALLIARRPGRAFLSCGMFLLGMAAATLPWLVYFAASHALDDMFRYYFLYNIFGYSGDAQRSVFAMLLDIGRNTLATFRRNPQYGLLIALGVFWLSFFRDAEASRMEKWNVWALCVASCCGIYIGGLGLRYYGVVLTVFAALGLVPLLRLFNRRVLPHLQGRVWARALPCALLALSLAICPLISDNAYMLGWKRDELPQFRFADTMRELSGKENPSVLSYQMMDSGFYFCAGYEPDFRCFTRLNIAQEEILSEQDRYLDEGLTEFVVTRNQELAHENYELVGSASYFYEEGEKTYRLYRIVS